MFDWHFTPTHSSSDSFATLSGAALHALLRALQPGHGWLTRFQVYQARQIALFTLGFPLAPAVAALTGPRLVTRRVILQKARDHRGTEVPYGSHCVDAVGFRLSFTPLAGVLFTVPSRYCALSVTIRRVVLDRGRPSIPRGFSSPVVLELGQTLEHMNDYGTVTRCGLPFQAVRGHGFTLALTC